MIAQIGAAQSRITGTGPVAFTAQTPDGQPGSDALSRTSPPVLPEPNVPIKPPFPAQDWPCIQPRLFEPLPADQFISGAARRFAVIGDAGNGLQPQFDIAAQMARTYQATPFSSVLVLGDNVYEYGDPRLFPTRIKAPYRPLFDQGVRFYPAMGNHDMVMGYGPQQMAYWGVPQFYSRKVGNVEMFAIDTTVFLPGYCDVYKDNPALAEQQAKVQLAWLEKALADSKAKYKVVFGHYPLYSSGMHGTKDDATLKLRKILEPVFQKNGVDLYLAGHEHHYEKSKVIGGVQHFVSGAAGKLRPNIFYKDNPPYPREEAFAKYHFMLFEETDQGLKYNVLSRSGKTLDAGIVVKQPPSAFPGYTPAPAPPPLMPLPLVALPPIPLPMPSMPMPIPSLPVPFASQAVQPMNPFRISA